MKETLIRVGMALLFLPVLAFTLLSQDYHSLYFTLLIALVGTGGLLELALMLKKLDIRIYPALLIPSLLGAYWLFYKGQEQYLPVILIGVLLVGVFLQVFRPDFEKVIYSLGLMVFAFVYLGIMWGTLIVLKQTEMKHLLVLISATWFCDIGAYFAGKLLGRHKMDLKVSSNKTLEGFIGGVILALVAAKLTAFWTGIPFFWWLAFIPFATIVGDLLESIFKRACKAKDSSRIIPGHGGILDVFDSLIFTGPIYFYALKFLS